MTHVRTSSCLQIKPSSITTHQSWAANQDQSVQEPFHDLKLAELTTSFSSGDKTLWCWMNPRQRPCFTPALLKDIDTLQRFIINRVDETRTQIDYLVLGSSVTGVFNLGGDLALFAETIRRRDRVALQHYARACVTVGYTNHMGYNNKVTTIALLEGDALGGGFECALSCDILIAERHVKFMLPEILFNLFPGMGAYSFLSRRIGSHKTENMMRSGRNYSAEELFEIGAIDYLVETDTGREAVNELIAQQTRRRGVMSALYQIRRRVNGVSLSEMNDITDLWVDTAMGLTDADLRKMCHLAAAQDRFRTRSSEQSMAGRV